MSKSLARILVVPLVVLALACSGTAIATSLAPGRAFAAAADQPVASASYKALGVQASKSSKAKKAFSGKYELIKMKQDGNVTGKKDLDQLRSLGYNVTLNLKKNGKATFDVFGEKLTGAWKASSTKRGKLKLEGGSTVTMKKNGKKITMTNNGASLVFKKK